MDAEEKKSLPSSDPRAPQNRQSGLRLHYFPDIPIDEPTNLRPCMPTEGKFQRIRYDHADSSCVGTGLRTDGNPNFPKSSLSNAELHQHAYQKGFADGKKQGIPEGEKKGFEFATQKLEPVLTMLQEALTQVGSIQEVTSQRIEKEIVELSLAIARQVICREISLDSEIVVCVAQEALSKVEDPGNIKIKMNTSDLQFLKEAKSQLTDRIANIDNVTLEAEESIQSGGCVIETDSGEIDARIEKQLQAIEESFRAAMEKSTLDG